MEAKTSGPQLDQCFAASIRTQGRVSFFFYHRVKMVIIFASVVFQEVK